MSVRCYDPSFRECYLLDQALLDELRTHMPWLTNWSPPDLGTAKIGLDPCAHGMNPIRYVRSDSQIVNGIIEVWWSDGTADPAQMSLNYEQHQLSAICDPTTQFFLLRHMMKDWEANVDYTWSLVGQKNVTLPYTPPTTNADIAKMIARGCGYEVA